MQKIKILPDILSNKIAAGEVVERPASVVKELLENAIDAGSTRVIVEIENGGRRLIRVSDNGVGMNHDDALLSLERYATSKIHTDADLFAIKTMGFRGEALPSIASVSRFTLTSRDADSEAGTEIKVEGGAIKTVRAVGAPVGTMISVEQLFFNTPARRKFLKSVTTEMGHISEAVAAIALGAPQIRFQLRHNGNTVKDWPLSDDPFDRVTAVLGHDIRHDLHPMRMKTPATEISGWISAPALSRSSSQKIYLYVNGRYIRDRGLQHALFEGYRGRLMKGRFPIAVIFIQVPCDQLDINVHPTKHEVRFSGYRGVYDALKTAVMTAWDRLDSPARAPVPPGFDAPGAREADMPPPTFSPPRDNSAMPSYGPSQPEKVPSPMQPAPRARPDAIPGVQEPAPDYAPPIPNHSRLEKPSRQEPETPPATPDIYEQKPLWAPDTTESLRVVGQLHNTYIVCESQDGIVLVDQHAAHERVLFEQFQKQTEDTPPPTQRLLMPETIDLGFKEATILDALIPQLARLGLEIDPFGGNTYAIKTVPSLLADREIKPLIHEMIDTAADTGFTNDVENALSACKILMACHGALRAHHPLNEQEMVQLIRQLNQCDNPAHCPHGRPTWIRWPLKSLEKSFKRIV